MLRLLQHICTLIFDFFSSPTLWFVIRVILVASICGAIGQSMGAFGAGVAIGLWLSAVVALFVIVLTALGPPP